MAGTGPPRAVLRPIRSDGPEAVQPAPEASVAARIAAALSTGRSAVVSGPAGIGKSRALRHAAGHLGRDGRRPEALRATGSVAAVPFGALLPLLDGHEPSRSRTATAHALLSMLREHRDTVLMIDDAHLLDAPSAGVIHQAAAAGVALAVAIRDGEEVPDGIARLVPDLDAVRIPVPRLTEPGTAGMLAELLDGPVDDRLVQVVHRRSAGLPLAVQALARVAREAGAIERVGSEWRMLSPIPISDELGALMRGTTASLDDDARRAAELVALAEQLTESQLLRAGAQLGTEAAERAGVVSVDPGGTATLAHPLLLDALTSDLSGLRRRRRLAELLDAVDDGDALVGRLRRAEWSLELGRPVDVGELLALVDVTAADDPVRAERLARVAAEGGGVAARLRLAELLAHLHRDDDAEAVLRSIDPTTDEARIAVALTRAFLLAFALARPDDALRVLDDLPDVPMARALRSSAHLHLGRAALAK